MAGTYHCKVSKLGQIKIQICYRIPCWNMSIPPTQVSSLVSEAVAKAHMLVFSPVTESSFSQQRLPESKVRCVNVSKRTFPSRWMWRASSPECSPFRASSSPGEALTCSPTRWPPTSTQAAPVMRSPFTRWGQKRLFYIKLSPTHNIEATWWTWLVSSNACFWPIIDCFSGSGTQRVAFRDDLWLRDLYPRNWILCQVFYPQF